MTRYQVDSDAVLAATAAARTAIGRIQSEVAGLTGQLGQLQSSWSGAAATAFSSAAADWGAMQHRVEESLSALSHALGIAGQQYADIESANARLFGR